MGTPVFVTGASLKAIGDILISQLRWIVLAEAQTPHRTL